ncbi:hypothetical protein DPMN_001132 [Dreissena polymorpha]|uniref:Uncharacterized protein n=1 Tax=Dreissena polymorpha TaxID=45954 RepID=A0A9D4MKE4_DREPO|nr:hypothetical protein DPMN_001132 [Dreissena polymorpha]
MEISTEKSKIKVNSTITISADITVNGEKLKNVTCFKYLGANLSKDGTSTAEVRIELPLRPQRLQDRARC